MSQTKHTPGPWVIAELKPMEAPTVWAVEGGQIASLSTVGQFQAAQTLEEVQTNARLIAAAPTMASALDEVEETLGSNLHWLADQLDAAIRQNDPETLRRFKQLNAAWETVVKARSGQ